MKETPIKVRRIFDETFKREAVQNWLSSGKTAGVIAKELGLKTRLLYSLLMLLALPSSLRADLLYNKVGDTVTITGSNPKASGDLVIPATIDNLPVTSIDFYAFFGCTGLTKITIPNTVTLIGSSAFQYCHSLTSIIIPDSVTSIGSSAFKYCLSLTSISIPDSVTSIASWAFYGCSGLTSITIPNSVTSIEGYAFYGCTGLTNVTIGNSVTSIGYGAFRGCTGLTAFNVASNNSAYSSLDGVLFNKAQTELISFPAGKTGAYTVPSSVTSIGSFAFYGCTGLTSITIPNSVTSIGNSAFDGCTNLTAFTVAADNPAYSSLDGVIFNKTRTELVLFPNGRTGVYSIPSGVNSIGSRAFGLITGLTKITIPNTVTSIGSSAFEGCTGLTNVTIGNSVTSIGSGAFSGCSGLTSITIPNSVTSIASWAFYNCDGLTNIIIPDSVTQLGNNAFYSCDRLATVTIGNSVTSIGSSAFCYCPSLTNIIIPDSVTTIGWYAFAECYGLTTVTIGENVNFISAEAFRSSRNLANFYFTGNAPQIGWANGSWDIFGWDTPGPRVYYIFGKTGWDSTFCSRPTALWPTPAITSSGNAPAIVGQPFHYPILATGHRVTFASTDPPPGLSLDTLTGVISGNPTTAGIYPVTLTATNPGGTDTQILTFHLNSLHYTKIDDTISITGSDPQAAGILVIPSTIEGLNVTSIGEGAFRGRTGLTAISLPESLVSIGANAFESCSQITTLTLPKNITSLGDFAFSNCNELLRLEFTGNAPSLGGGGVFDSTPSLTVYYVPGTAGWDAILAERPTAPSTPPTITSTNIVPALVGHPFTHLIVANDIRTSFATTDLPPGLTLDPASGIISGTPTSAGTYTVTLSAMNAAGTGTQILTVYVNSLNYSSDGTSIRITGSTPSATGYLVIPETIDNLPVTTIAPYAFYGHSSLTSVTIPDSVTSIEYYSFSSCDGLRNVTLGNKVSTIGNDAFSHCSKLTGLTFPDRVTSIGGNAFQYCHSLTSVTMGDGVTSIENGTFSSCSALTSITIGSSVTSIGESAFANCSALTNITIPNSVSSIRNVAFYNCDGLTSLAIPNTVTSIGDFAFSDCDRLATVTIGSGLTSMARGAFSGSSNFSQYVVDENNSTFSSRDGVLFNKDRTILVSVPSGLKGSYIIPDTVTSIGNRAFLNCGQLTNITIPDSVRSIETYAFLDCSQLKSITIPDSVTSIGNNAFERCYGLTKAIIGNGLTAINHQAFIYCTGLTNVTIGSAVISIGQEAFYGCNALRYVSIPDSVTAIEHQAFANCQGLASVSIGNGLTTIDKRAFYNCNELTNVAIGNGLATLDRSAFEYCRKLTSFSVGSGNVAFSSLDGVLFNKDQTVLVTAPFGMTGSYTIPDTVTSIGNEAFRGCTGMTNVTFSTSVASIGNYAFSDCDALTSITLPNSVTSIGDYAFHSCNNLATVTLGNRLTSIGIGAFYYCPSLTSIIIPNSVTSIGNYAFQDCDGLTSITILDSVTSIGDYAFHHCDKLATVTLGNGVPSIGSHAFSYCPSLTSVTMGSGVTWVNYYSFYADSGLKSVYFMGNAPGNSGWGIFDWSPEATVYWIPGTTGWENTFLGRPTAPSAPPTIISPLVASGKVGQPFNYSIVPNDSRTTIAATDLPPGLSHDPQTSVISGIPTTDGTHLVTLFASNTAGTNTQVLTLTFLPLTPVLTHYAVATVGLPFRYKITAANIPTLYSAVDLPLGLSLDEATGVIFGIPTAEGTHTITLSASNAGGIDTEILTLAISLQPLVSTVDAVATVGQPFTYKITSNNSAIFFAATGLPSGLAIDSFTGVISGLLDREGTRTVILSAFNAAGTDTQILTLTVLPVATEITSPTTATATVGIPFQYAITAKHGPTYYGVTTLPSGLTFDPITGVISGIPTAESTSTVTLSAFNGAGKSDHSLTLIVLPEAPVITSAINATASIGLPFSYHITASPAPKYFEATGLPTGLVLDPLTGIISGIPAVLGTHTITLSASNAAGTGTQTFTLTVIPPPPVFTSPNTADAFEGQSFTYSTVANNAPTAFGATGLPSGLSIDPTTGVISGTPVTHGTHTVTLSASNAAGTGTQTFTLTVTPAPIAFLYTRVGDTITITGSNPKATGDLVIPATIDGLPVTAIRGTAFRYSPELASVTIPDSIISIGEEAFAGCPKLTSVTIGNGVATIPRNAFRDCSGLDDFTVGSGNPYFSSRDGVLFNKTQKLLIAFPAGRTGIYIVPNSVTSVGYSAFSDCPGLTSVTIPNSVTSIGNYAFFGCSGLTDLTIGSNVASIGAYAFCGSTGLTSVIIPESVTTIGNSAFESCVGLRSLTIGSKVTSIGEKAFSGCTGLTSVTIPENVSSITFGAFSNCVGLSSVYFMGNAPSFKISVFDGSPNSTVYYVPGTTGWASTFAGRPTAPSAAPTITSPVTASAIAGQPFTHPITANDIRVSFAANGLPPGLTLDSTTGVISGIPTFNGTYTVTLSGSNAAGTGTQTFTLTVNAPPNAFLFTRVGDSITVTGREPKATGNLVIPPTIDGLPVTAIGAGAFSDSGITGVTIPDSVTSIGDRAFFSCSSLTNVTIPNLVTSIGKYSFAWCSDLRTLTLGNSVSSIAQQAFTFSGLTNITFPASVSSIGDGAFYDSTRLTKVSFIGNAPSIGINPFGGAPINTVYYVPGTKGWSNTFADRPTTPSVAPTITSPATASVLAGQPFTHTVAANDTRISFGANGLPPELTFDSTTGAISGLPATEGTYYITLTASNAAGTGTQTLTLTVIPPAPVLTVYAVATIGLPFRYSITAENTPTRFNATGLPSGLSLDPVNGVISGIPTTEGSYTIILSASNAAGSDSHPLLLAVSLPSKINYDPAKDQFELKIQSGGNKEQMVEYTDDFKQWIPLDTKLVGTKNLSELDPQAGTRPFRFYRVIQR